MRSAFPQSRPPSSLVITLAIIVPCHTPNSVFASNDIMSFECFRDCDSVTSCWSRCPLSQTQSGILDCRDACYLDQRIMLVSQDLDCIDGCAAAVSATISQLRSNRSFGVLNAAPQLIRGTLDSTSLALSWNQGRQHSSGTLLDTALTKEVHDRAFCFIHTRVQVQQGS